jgi:hypothetical protein
VLTDIDYFALEYICLNMREEDKREVYALRSHDNPILLASEAHSLVKNCGRGRIGWHKGRPAAVCAFTEQWKGTWEVWMFGTDEFRNVAVDMLRWFRKEAVEILSEREGRRLHCDSAAYHEEAHRMIRATGAIEEARFKRYGKDGDDFIRFVWFNGQNDAILKPHFTRVA